MKVCPTCGFEAENSAMRCPECGAFYSKIIELIEKEAADEESQSFKGLCRRIFNAEQKKAAIFKEFDEFKAGLTGKAKFTLWVIVAFVFALIVTVL